MKMRIFPRILLATMLPLTLIFVVVISAINNVIYTSGTELSRDLTKQVAGKASYQVSMHLSDMETLLDFASRTLALQSNQKIWSRSEADRLLRLLLGGNPNYYCAWFAFEPGIFESDEWYHQCLIKEDAEIMMTHQPPLTNLPSLLKDRPRLDYPRSTGQVYLNLVNTIDYGLGHGPVTVGTMAYPIISGGRVIGVVGLDIRYADMVPPTVREFEQFPHTLLLLSGEGVILHSSRPEDVGRNLSEFLPDCQDVLPKDHEGPPRLKEIESPFLKTRALACVYPIRLDQTEQMLFVYLDFPLATIYAPIYSSMRNIVLISLVGLAVLFLSTLGATRHIIRPIEELTVNIKKMSRGDLDSVPNGQELEKLKSNVVELEIMRLSLGEMLEEISTAHDISLKAAEAKIEKERLIAAAEAKSRFFASMSHEIRTPMNAVLGIADILLESAALTGEQRRYVNDIKISSVALLTIINDILDLSKMEAGRMQLSPTHFDLRMLLTNICSLAQFMANAKNLSFKLTILGTLPQCLFGDDDRLRQILLNLISNAIKYTRQGSVGLEVEATAEGLRFSVSDTGIGVREEDMARIFDPFQRTDANRNRNIQGTGLGLPISKNLVELMGGKIEMSSTYGQGSVFSFHIPQIMGDPAALEPRETTRSKHHFSRDLRILVVDDNEINLSVAAGLLSTFHGVASDLASSGREALEKLKHNQYQLVFMDHVMPEMDGVETTKRIRALGGRWSQVPIIAFTANAVTGIREMLLGAGFNDYLAKPLNKDELALILNKWAPADGERETICRLKTAPKTKEKAEALTEAEPAPPDSGPDRRLIRLYQDLLRLDDDMVAKALRELEASADDQELASILDLVKEQLAVFDFEAAAELVRDYRPRPAPQTALKSEDDAA